MAAKPTLAFQPQADRYYSEGYWRRGDLTEALTCLAACEEQLGTWGGGDMGLTYCWALEIGLHLDRGSIAIDLPEVDLGVARIHPFHVGYEDDPFVFEDPVE